MKSSPGFAIILLSLSLAPCCAWGATNEWTKLTSGYWEESYWSLGLPNIEQEVVAFRNPGWKALAIGADTTAHYPASLSLNSLVVDAPTGSSNQLLLNWAGLDVSLNVHQDLTIGTNASLTSHYSALRAANACIDGSASFSDSSTEDFGQLSLRTGSTVNLTNGSMTTSNLIFHGGTFTQGGGSHVAQNVDLPLPLSSYWAGAGLYNLQGGAFTSKRLVLGYPNRSGLEGFGVLVQTGGVHTNAAMEIRGYYTPYGGSSAGRYLLQSGWLVSHSLISDGGYYAQSGGTNWVQELKVKGGGDFELAGGELLTSNSVVNPDLYVRGRFTQSGGTHIVRDRLLVQGGFYENPFNPEYMLSGGSVVASNLQISGATLSLSSNAVLATSRIDLGAHLYVSSRGMISNTGIIAISGKSYATIYDWPNLEFDASVAEPQYLGQLQVYSGAVINCLSATPVRFADSHTLQWTGPLRIRFPGLGSDTHIFFGTNALGLTAAQLAQTEFETGYDGTRYAAMLLPTGELVPAVPPPLGFTNTGTSLILSWPGPYELLSATNVLGPYLLIPGAASPMTVTFTDPERYFRLRLPAP